MHMLLVITGGLILCGVFALFGKLWGGDMASVANSLKLFVPAWLVIALINMWVGSPRPATRWPRSFRSCSWSSPSRL